MNIQYPEQFKLIHKRLRPEWKRRFMMHVARYMILHDRISTALSEPNFFNIQRMSVASYAFGLHVGYMSKAEFLIKNSKYKARWDELVIDEANRIMDSHEEKD